MYPALFFYKDVFYTILPNDGIVSLGQQFQRFLFFLVDDLKVGFESRNFRFVFLNLMLFAINHSGVLGFQLRLKKEMIGRLLVAVDH